MEKKTVVEFNGVRGSGDNEQGLFTSSSEGVARMRLAMLAEEGAQDLHLVKRTATYPLGKDGKPQATGSEVETEELPL